MLSAKETNHVYMSKKWKKTPQIQTSTSVQRVPLSYHKGIAFKLVFVTTV